MAEYLLALKDLRHWLDAIIKNYKTIAVQAKDDKFDYAELNDAENLRLDFEVTLTPPKKYFLPPEEGILSFKANSYSSVWAEEEFVLFGLHPYDLVAINQLKKLFEQNKADEHFLKRLDQSILVALDVEKPSANVFAGFLGYATVKDGYDLLLSKIDNEYFIEVKTPKGQKLIKLFNGFKQASDQARAKRKQLWQKNEEILRKHHLKLTPSQISLSLKKAYDNSIWKEKAKLCFSCGSCNLVCPTCYCFDVKDLLDWNLENGKRIRTWDGCMLEPFALVAGGHNFRKGKDERYRHRYYRKGLYVPEKIGEFACVGCGRCIGACVAKIANPVEVFNAIMEG